ncbi:MAG: ABC transporter substrate-binding protein [Candidatus Binatia bacterium]
MNTMPLKQRILVAAILLQIIFGFPPSTQAKSQKLTVAISALSAGYTPIYIAKDAGFFKKHGIDVELVFMPFGQLVHAMIAEDVEVAAVGASRVMASNLEGSGLVFLAMTNNRHPYKFLVSPDITKPEQLKGKKVGVGRFGGLDDTAMRYALSQFGLRPDEDVTILQVGGKSLRFAALKKGAISGIMIDPPYTLMGRELGMNSLFDMLKSSPKMVYGVIAAKQSYIDQNPDLIRNLLKGYIQGIDFYKSHKAESIKIMAKYMKVALPEKKEEMEETYNAFVPTASCEPYVDMGGVKTLLKQLEGTIPEAKTADVNRFVDMHFLRELDKSGFIDSNCKGSSN